MTIRQDPAARVAAVTPTNDLYLGPVRALYVGGAGDVTLKCEPGDSAVLFAAVPAGSILPVQASIIMATGTDATGIVAFY